MPENVSKTSSRLIRNKPARYIVAVVAVALAVLFREVLEQKFGALPPYITFSPAVIVAVLLGDMWAGLLASVLSVLAADYLALPPRGHFAIANPADVVSLAVFFISGASICVITELFHRNRQKLAAYQLEKAVEAERSKAEEVRKVSEATSAERQRFFGVLETLPQMISLLTPDHRMVFANHSSREKFGEADGRRCYEARFGRTEPCEVCESFTGLETGKPHRWEVSHPDGALIEVYDIPFTDVDGSPLVLKMETDISERRRNETQIKAYQDRLEVLVSERTLQWQTANAELKADIAKRERAEQALRASEEKYRSLFDTMLEGFCVIEVIFDAEQRPVDYGFLETNPAFEAQTGLHDVRGKTIREIAPGNASYWYELCGRVALTGEPVRIESETKALNSWFEVFAYRVGRPESRQVAILFSNITERKRAEQALRDSQKESQFLADMIRLSSQPLDIGYPDGRLGLINRAFEELTGYTGEELRSIDWALALTPPEWRAVEQIQFAELRRTGLPVRYEKEYTRKDGTRVPVELLVHLVRDPEGEPLYYYSFVTDITERKQAEERLNRLNRTMKALSNSNQALLHASDEAAFLAEVCRIIRNDCGHTMVWIGFAENDESKSVRPVASSGFEEGYLESIRVTWDESERGRGPVGTAIRTEKPSICRNMLTDPNFLPWRHEASKRGYASAVGIPLKRQDESWGAITIYSREPDSFSQGEVDLLTELAEDLAFGIQTLRLRAAHAQAERALRESEERFRLALANAPVSVAVQDPNLVYRWSYNQRTLQADEIVGKTDADLFAPEDIPVILESKRKVLETGTEAHLQHWVTSNGRRMFLDLHYEPTRDAAGKITGIGIAVVDLTERKLAEDALRESQERLRVTLASIGDAVMTTDTSGRVTYLNPVAAALTGWKPDEAAGQPIQKVFSVIHEQTRETAEDVVSRALKERRAVALDNHTSLVSLDGREIPIEDSAAPIFDAAGNVLGVVLVFHDVTQRRRAIEAMRLTSAIVDSSADAILGKTLQGVITSWNRGAERLYGYSAEMIGKPVSMLIPVELRGDEQIILQSVAKGERIEHYETVRKRKDGELIDVSLSVSPIVDGTGKVIGASIIARDITERKNAEEALRASEEQFRNLANSIPQLCWMANADGFIFWYNERWYQYTGATPEQMEGRGWQSVHDPNELPKVLERWNGSVATGEPFDMVFPLRGADGVFRPFLTRVMPVRNAEGKVMRWFGTNTDITETRRAEEALLRSEKLASVGRMAASVSHEINNPLEAITNTLYLARLNVKDPDSVCKFLGMADDELARIAHITRQTLGFYRETTVPVPVSVNSVLDSAIDVLRSKIKKTRPRIEKQFDGDLLVTAIPGELRQVFANLLGNSMDALGPEGVIELRISRSTCVISNRPRVRVTVADNGHGIEAATLKRIFEPLFTTKGPTGTGLGLWVASQIVEKHGGSIRVRSRTADGKQGTVFSVVLPVEPKSDTAVG